MSRRQPAGDFATVFRILSGYYGSLHWWPAETPFEVCVGAILTQNTAWTNVEKSITALKSAGVLSFEGMLKLDQQKLADLIRSAGFFNIKSRRIKAFVDWVQTEFGGSLDCMFAGEWTELRGRLLTVDGIGPETCDSILLYAGHKPSFVVDNYTRRLFQRLGLLGGDERYEEIRGVLMSALPADVLLFNEYHAVIVEHCKRFCRKRPDCRECPLGQICVHAIVDEYGK